MGNFARTRKMTMAARALPIGRELARRGHRVTMILPPWDEPGESGRRETIDAVAIENLVVPALPPALLHPVLAATLTQRAWSHRPDVLYVFKPKAHAGMVQLATFAVNLARRRGIRLVLDTDDLEGSGGWADLLDYPPALRRFVDWHERWCLRHAAVVTVASRALERHASRLGVRADRIVYVPNAADERSPTWVRGDGAPIRRRHGLGIRPVVLLYSRFFDFDPRRAAAVLGRVRERVPDLAVLIVGAGERDEEGRLCAALAAEGLGEVATFAGWVPFDEVRHYLAAATAAYFPLDPTPLNEARCSIKLIDLLLGGVPVVAERVGQVAEYLEDGRTGRIVGPGDVEAAAAALVGYIGDEGVARQRGEAARATVLTKHTWRDRSRVLVQVVGEARELPL